MARGPESGLGSSGEGITGTLLPDDNSQAPAVHFSAEELKAQGLVQGAEVKVKAVNKVSTKTVELPPIIVKVSGVVYEKVPVYESHRRRSLASRGAKAVSVGQSGSYRTIARRKQVDLDLSPIICKYAKMYHLDPWLVRGVIQVESNFQPYAGSPVGAGGLMQLMAGTAAGLGCRDRFDPEANIAAGCRYLRQLLNMFNGNLTLAIAAYNAGPGNVSRYGGVPPFTETRNYVVRVTKAWKEAKARYGK